MKSIKYTAVALALIAAATFTNSARAASSGDLILGLYDNNSLSLPSLEFDLGAFNTLSNGETFDLGSTIASAFSSDSSASLQLNIVATGGGAGAATLAAKEIAFTASSVPTLPAGGNSTENTNVSSEVNTYSSGTAVTLPSTTSSNGTAISAVTVAAGTGSFETEINANGGSFGFGGNGLLSGYPASGPLNFYTGPSKGVVTPDGTFTFGGTGGDVTLTYQATATPEPSAYALGLCAAALFWVLKRRRSVA